MQFKSADDGRRAMEQLNGFQLGGRPMTVGVVSDESEKPSVGQVPDMPLMDSAFGYFVYSFNVSVLIELLDTGKTPEAAAKEAKETAVAESKATQLNNATGVDLGVAGRQALMAKLAENAGARVLFFDCYFLIV